MNTTIITSSKIKQVEQMSELPEMRQVCDELTGLPALPDGEADRTVKHYRCSGCWGHLNKFPIRGTRLWAVRCAVCGDQTRGYVSSKWVDRKLSESHAELQEARIALHDALPSLPKPSEKDLMERLGF